MALNLSQLPIEIVRGDQPAPTLRLSQLPIEILRGPEVEEPLAPAVQLSQLPIEVLCQQPLALAPIAVTQLFAELLTPVPPAPLGVSQLAAEILTSQASTAETRVTDLCCELIIIRVVPRTGCPTDFPFD